MTDPACPETGAPLSRGVRPLTITYKNESLTVEMPGWYCDQSEESRHTGDDMKVSDRALTGLKARAEGLLEAKEILRIRKKLGLTQANAMIPIAGHRLMKVRTLHRLNRRHDLRPAKTHRCRGAHRRARDL